MSLMLPIFLAAANVVTGGVTHITSGTAYYDRKEGFACFGGKVMVVDPQYVLHADRAFVYMGETNDLKRIVALGNVAITNEMRRASGAKASYYRSSGLVVLNSGEGKPAEVRDERPDGDQIVRGRKIKFWIGSHQVEVVEAEITAPSGGGLDAVQGMTGR